MVDYSYDQRTRMVAEMSTPGVRWSCALPTSIEPVEHMRLKRIRKTILVKEGSSRSADARQMWRFQAEK